MAIVKIAGNPFEGNFGVCRSRCGSVQAFHNDPTYEDTDGCTGVEFFNVRGVIRQEIVDPSNVGIFQLDIYTPRRF